MKIVVFTGAGISAESGIQTFRDSDGLWEKNRIEDVATLDAFKRNPQFVLDFYNERRKQILSVSPNKAHIAIAKLQEHHEVLVITQNIDDLHERAGSKKVVHLHGEIIKARSSGDEEYVVNLTKTDIELGDLCPMGHQLRPHIVWFGEAVPKMLEAYKIAEIAEVFIIIGTSLNVYPAAGIIDYVGPDCSIYLVDPKDTVVPVNRNLKHIKANAGQGVPELLKQWIPTS